MVRATGTGWPVPAPPPRHRAPVGSARGRSWSDPSPAAAPYRVVHDGGASLVRRSPQQRRTVTRGSYPPIGRRPAPDGPGNEVWPEAKGQLAFDFAALTRPPTPPPAARPGDPVSPPAEPRPTASPEARHAAGRFARACLEILNGYRPVAHVRSLSQPATAHTLIEHLIDALRRMPGPPALPRRQQPLELVRLRSLRISEPTPGIVEAAAALGTDTRTWAMAFRLEHSNTTWLGTVLQVL
ncbi:Rv3235 family protein [Asanoa siamensis]|uniref:Uncharacterized protein n=1 Tax=Asanoa siamensis TaxID=926357 RepID=A0ABQ4D0E1_9ACTN|nr:Rv3235 family protein [Asanoa siamensis]GIF77012.1 hypothetical protein Asi02nite_65300 [Asanoa siamensis]